MGKYSLHCDEEYKSLTELLKDADLQDSVQIDRLDRDEHGKDSVSFSIDQVPYCCGVFELGDLSSTTLTNKEMNMIFTELLKSKYVYIMNIIKDCERWEEWLSKTSLFKKIREFKNPNSGNMVRLWVSQELKPEKEKRKAVKQ